MGPEVTSNPPAALILLARLDAVICSGIFNVTCDSSKTTRSSVVIWSARFVQTNLSLAIRIVAVSESFWSNKPEITTAFAGVIAPTESKSTALADNSNPVDLSPVISFRVELIFL